MIVKSRYDYYQILEINRSAPQHEITKAYERAKMTFSGDNNAIYTIFSQGEARELMTLIEEAYAVLGNKMLRSIYDQRISRMNKPEDLTYTSILSASRQGLPDIKEDEKIEYSRDENFEKEIQEKQDWNGEFIKKVREYKKVKLDKLNEKTKINSFYINAIEVMDSKNLPAPVFVRGYVIQIAKALGLNEKLVADSYMKRYNEL